MYVITFYDIYYKVMSCQTYMEG